MLRSALLTALVFVTIHTNAAEKSEYVAKIKVGVNLAGDYAEFDHEIKHRLGDEIAAEFIGPNALKLIVRLTPIVQKEATQYKAAFKIISAKDTLSAPTILVNPDQTGSISVGEKGRESIKIDLIVTEK
jgi:hypothetical protein